MENRTLVTNGLVDVGDIILVKSAYGANKYIITRTTKTLAMSKRKSEGYEYTFKRKIGYKMAHQYQMWDTSDYDSTYSCVRVITFLMYRVSVE